MKIMFKNYIYEAIEMSKASPAFKAWFGASKVVDDDGEPLNVYHGTTHDFDTFDLKKTYTDGYVGAGFYFTSNPHDGGENYAGKGPDAQNKIDLRVEEIEANENDEISNILGMSIDEVEEAASAEILRDMIKEYAEKEILGENPKPNIMPVYLRIQNPYYLGEEHKQYFDYEYGFDEETETESEPSGIGAILIEKLTEELNELDLRDPQETLSKILEDLSVYDGGFSSNEFFKAIKDRYELVDAYSGDENVKIGNFFKTVILAAGFDGVIMDASVFERMKGTAGTNHYIVYSPNQIKSVNNQNPSDHPSILKEDEEVN
jgi:hypothetical protein